MDWHVVEARVRYLTLAEGGRKTGVASGYRGQFFYGGRDYDAIHSFPEVPSTEFVELGSEVRTFVRFPRDRWEIIHRHRLYDGMSFEIHEGARVVGKGNVTRLAVADSEWTFNLG